MSNFQFDLDPEKLKARKYPAWLVKTVLIVSVLPFLSFGGYMVGHVLRAAPGQNHKLVIPFILFVLFFCAMPVLYVFSVLKKMNKIQAAGLTAAPPTPAEEMPPGNLSRIRAGNTPDECEFIFPPARNPGMAFVIAALMLFWAVMIWGLLFIKAPLFVPILLGLAGVIIVLGCLSLWFRQTSVRINRNKVSVSKRWLVFGRTHSFDAGEIARFDTQTGRQMTHDVHLVTRNEKKTTIISAISSKPGAESLAKEMNKALGREA